MNCRVCGTYNNEGAKFCIRCGQSLAVFEGQVQQPVKQPEPTFQRTPVQNMNTVLVQNNVSSTPVMNNVPAQNNFQTNVAPMPNMNNVPVQNNVSSMPNMNNVPVQNNFQTATAPTTNASVNSNTSTSKVSFMEYFFIILAVILKPFTSAKEESNKFNDFKNSAVMSLIVSGVATIVKLITTMLNAVIVKGFDWKSGDYQTTWVWENLKELEYLELIGKNFLIYLGVIAAIAGVYYLASLVFKKQANFSRLLGLSAISITPMLVCSLVLSPLLTLIWSKLTIPVILIGFVYTVIMIYEGMNKEIPLEGDFKYYFNLICLSVLGFLAYYLLMKSLMTSISGGLDDLMNMFG